MIERDPLHMHALVEAHQAKLRREFHSSQAGPGPVRKAIGRQLIHWGEVLGGKHADLQAHRPATPAPINSALAPR